MLQVFGGLLQVWNSSCLPEQTVQALHLTHLQLFSEVFDRLVEVNGKVGSKLVPLAY